MNSTWAYWIGSVAEAIFVLGAERNADRVWGLSYAPLLQNLNSYEWSPDLISYTADPAQTVLSTSYEVLKLFGTNAFTSTLPAEETSGSSDRRFGSQGTMSTRALTTLRLPCITVPRRWSLTSLLRASRAALRR